MLEDILNMTGIVKKFGGVCVLNNVQLNVRQAEVVGLVGENGAGKSTIMKCLIGEHQADGGEIIFNGKKLHNHTTKIALKEGIAMIHQELSPVLDRNVMENIWLGREPKNSFGLVSHKKMFSMTIDLLKEIDSNIDPKTIMKALPIADIQMIEIAKAISYNAKLIIMDEPTSALTKKEVDSLFKIIHKLKEKKTSIIYISHRMDEIYKVTDRITVFRDGCFVHEGKTSDIPLDLLIKMMVGRDLTDMYVRNTNITSNNNETVLEVKNLSGKKFSNISFAIRKGEILGVAGLVGSGRTELFESIFGCHKIYSGNIYMLGKKVKINSPLDAKKYKIALLTEDRKQSGIFPMLSVLENFFMAGIRVFLENGIFFNHQKAKKLYYKYHELLNIRATSCEQKIENLSGGNQQKVLLARWLMTDPNILILDEPTRGIDVGAKSDIYKIMTDLVKQGKSIVSISSEMPEILGISDRIMVMKAGSITAVLDNKNISQEDVLKFAT